FDQVGNNTGILDRLHVLPEWGSGGKKGQALYCNSLAQSPVVNRPGCLPGTLTGLLTSGGGL
ncbi:MAG: hypothetical protein WBN48_05855, partial [Thiogranum sp.]